MSEGFNVVRCEEVDDCSKLLYGQEAWPFSVFPDTMGGKSGTARVAQVWARRFVPRSTRWSCA